MDPSALRYPYGEINSCADARRDWFWWYYLAIRKLTATGLCTKVITLVFWLKIPISMDFSFHVFVSFSNF
jgi:hypothetical protein